MSYLDIDNLYKNQTILLFRECYAMEKIHGTSAHVGWKEGELHFFSGGAKHEDFVKLFDQEKLAAAFSAIGHDEVVVFGEAYGGKMQGMRNTYGPVLKFVCFEVKIGNTWLNVPNAEDVVNKLGLEFVHYVKVPATVEALNAERDAPSVQAIRNGCGEDKKREGIVIRPLVELTTSNGERVIAKHKADSFKETRTRREVSPEKLKVLTEADEIAQEWVTPMRLQHVMDSQFPGFDLRIEMVGKIIPEMVTDVLKESVGEIVDSKEVRKAIGTATAKLVKSLLQKDRSDPLSNPGSETHGDEGVSRGTSEGMES